MIPRIKNVLENFQRKKDGKEPLDAEITTFLHRKYADSYDLDALNSVHRRIKEYLDDLELRRDLLESKTILDLGSSGHFFDEYCKEVYDANVIALDIDQDALGKHHEMGVIGDARSLPIKSDAFDLVISHASMPQVLTNDLNEVTKHKQVEDLYSLFQEVYRVIKVGGQIRMSTSSEIEWQYLKDVRESRGEFDNAGLDHEIERVKFVKKALARFESESGAQCIYKENESGGLIVIRKVK